LSFIELQDQRQVIHSSKHYSEVAEFLLCRRQESRSAKVNEIVLVKQRQRNGKIIRRQRKQAFFHRHRTTDCKATIEWGQAQGPVWLPGGATANDV
jgi:hypothetical protein